MIDYKKFKIERLDPISPTFCAAKWLSADFWLETGTTSSCHLPPPHKIDLNSVANNIHTINNTKEKIDQRSQMLDGKRPGGCSNCWQIEEKNAEAITERIVTSYDNYSDRDFTTLDLSINQVPKIITVAFDSLCNFTCSYCDAGSSSSWATDLKINGPFKGIVGDSRNTYQRLGKKDKLSDLEYNFILNKFTDYVMANMSDIEYIRCLGGEPLFSQNFWKFLDTICQQDCSQLNLIIVTNLSDTGRIKKILNYRSKFKSIEFNVSIENIGDRAEFVRTGLDWQVFESNLHLLLESDVEIKLLSTVGLLALDGLNDFLNWYKIYDTRIKLDMFRLRYPIFQAPQVLPSNLKKHYGQILDLWISSNPQGSKTSPHLSEQIKNIVTILNDDCIIYNNVDVDVLRTSAKQFYKEYAVRHKHSIKDIFSSEMSDWILN